MKVCESAHCSGSQFVIPRYSLIAKESSLRDYCGQEIIN